MPTYKVFDFFKTRDIFTNNNYPIEEYRLLLEHFSECRRWFCYFHADTYCI